MHARRTLLVYAVLGTCLALSVVASLGVGAGSLDDARLRDVFLSLRGARVAAAFLAGAALAMGGVVVQGLFRNPLASPSILGTTAGASLGGQVALLTYQVSLGGATAAYIVPEMVVPIGCIIGAMGALAILLAFIREGGDILVLLLTGFILTALFLAFSGFIVAMAQESWELGRAMVSFSLGSVGGVGFRHVLFGLPLVVTGGVACWLWGRPLDVLLSGEDEAQTLGVDVRSARRWCAAWVAILTAAAVSMGGNVGFVGLVVPHALRPLVGASHRRLIPAAAFAGGTFLVVCDLISRVLPSRSEVPLGVVTGLIGAPIFLTLLLRSRREMAHG